ncbi:PREDICTED: peptidyl-prolyl cis-trans isomerase CYP26-1 [Camelina sativa]|uniref:Peptidyl-prolyl cis-trans isomerase n=1 Tax=Camelina sativa TaxID=90675 RepID=A0ABM0WB25_CAMSA|nr:PREDICTED: peptidyl-prolyl cis-trans isomerase CYP26-1 [Camelina sativa]
MANPKVFFDLTVDGKPSGRIVIELFADLTPRTAENFRTLCTGEKGVGNFGNPLHYKGSTFDRIVPDYMWCGGNIIIREESFYAEELNDDKESSEYFILNLDGPGIISMPRPDGSYFQILMKEGLELDDDHVVFGRVVEGLELMRSIEEDVVTETRKPSKPVVIADCGELSDSSSEIMIFFNFWSLNWLAID